MALKVKVGLIGPLDMLKFKKLADVRRKAIEKSEAKPLPKTLVTNEKARFIHPERQLVAKAEERERKILFGESNKPKGGDTDYVDQPM